MRLRPLRLLALLLCLLATPLSAALRLELDARDLTEREREASQALLAQALQALPPSLVERLDRRVQVRWSQTLRHDAFGSARGRHYIELNRLLLPALADGSAAQRQTGRSHATLERELLATLLHEIVHLYDRARLWAPAEQRRLAQCRSQAARLGAVGLADDYRGQTQRRFTLSDDPRLLDLAGWPQRVGRRGEREPRNAQGARSPDVYELSHPREFVAVNMEYFLLDPEYGCRRPGLQRYLSAHFGWRPAHASDCPADYAYLNAGLDPQRDILGQLDPERVYAVHYLLAEPNQAWVSRWGHSMLRLVVCAPQTPRGPDCLLDLDQHLVLSYRAFVGDLQLSTWDGLTGAYPSRLFILPLSQVIDEYTKLELRSLASVPLQLPREQLEGLVERAVEQHWSYDGDYYFFSNNCAVETLKLLRSGSARADLQTLDSITPTGLLQLLEARGLADRSPLRDPREALRLGYRFDSYRERYQLMFDILRQRLPIEAESVEQWLALEPAQRRPWIERADLRAAAALLLLEQAALRRQLLLAQDDLKRRYLASRGRQDSDLAQAGGAIEQMLRDSGFLSRPAELLEHGYGLPQAAEWQRLRQQSQARQRQLRSLAGELDGELRQLLEPQRLARIEAGERNLGELGRHLRRLHQASGGLQLP